MQLYELVEKNKQILSNFSHKFFQTFNRPLSNYVDQITGFDIVKFNDDLRIPDDQSVANFLTENYGEDICEMVKGLL